MNLFQSIALYIVSALGLLLIVVGIFGTTRKARRFKEINWYPVLSGSMAITFAVLFFLGIFRF